MGWDGIPADVFLDVLLRIPPCPRRRLRLVCRHWRHVFDERTPPEPRAQAKILAVFSRCRAFVVDGPPGGGSTELNVPGSYMIGTCNGLLCLFRDYGRRAEIAVTNPATRETIAVDLPTASWTWHRTREATYSFGYDPARGQYKILHVPCHEQFVSSMVFPVVHVFTLGGDGPSSSSWREVLAPAGSSCDVRFGFVTIDGVTYWAAADAERIMSFDLKDERVAFVECPPMPVAARTETDPWRQHHHLTDVRGRLGVAVSCRRDEFQQSPTEVWVLEGGREEGWRWVKRLTMTAHGKYPHQEVALPHVVHGEHVLTTWDGDPRAQRNGPPLVLSANPTWEEGKSRPCIKLLVGSPRPETVVAAATYGARVRTFAYVETREPLLVYGGRAATRSVIPRKWDFVARLGVT